MPSAMRSFYRQHSVSVPWCYRQIGIGVATVDVCIRCSAQSRLGLSNIFMIYCGARAGSQLHRIMGSAGLARYMAAGATVHPVATADPGPQPLHSPLGK